MEINNCHLLYFIIQGALKGISKGTYSPAFSVTAIPVGRDDADEK
jgi:hypothetical protein